MRNPIKRIIGFLITALLTLESVQAMAAEVLTFSEITGGADISGGVTIDVTTNTLQFTLAGEGGGEVFITFPTGYIPASEILDTLNGYFAAEGMTAAASLTNDGKLVIARTVGGTEYSFSDYAVNRTGAYNVLMRTGTVTYNYQYAQRDGLSGITHYGIGNVSDPYNPPPGVILDPSKPDNVYRPPTVDDPGNASTLFWIYDPPIDTPSFSERVSTGGYSFFNPMVIGYYNDNFKINANNTVSGESYEYDISIPHGSYTVDEMYDYLDARLSAMEDCAVKMGESRSSLQIESVTKGSGWFITLDTEGSTAFNTLYGKQRGIFNGSHTVQDVSKPTYSVSGRIAGSDAAGGLKAEVRVIRNGINYGFPVMANEDGSYSIPHIPPDSGYIVTVGMSGYVSGRTEPFAIVDSDIIGNDLILRIIKLETFAPPAPIMEHRTTVSITLIEIPGAEYRRHDQPDAWQDSPEFTGLEPSTGYTFYARLKETDTQYASPESAESAVFTTDGAYFNAFMYYFNNFSQSAYVTSAALAYDKSTGGDLTVTLNEGYYFFKNITNGTYTLIKDTDYTVDGNRYTINANYLDTLSNGEYTLIFNMSDGTDPTVTLTIQGKKAPVPTARPTAAPTPVPTAAPTAAPTPVPTTTPTAAPTPTVQPPPYINPFTDVKESDWFYDFAAYVYQNGLMTGMSTEPMTFGPNVPVSRGMMAAVLWHMAGSPIEPAGSGRFIDVPEETYYYHAVNWAAASGIVSGMGGGLYAPDTPISRQDLTVILYNYANFAGKTLPTRRDYPGFADEADIVGYAREAIEKFFKTMMINGKGGNVFDPKGITTRAEAAVLLTKFTEE